MEKVIMYCRKSSESEDRQALSIDSQIKELKEYAKNHDLEIVDIITESKSAKAPGRENFNTLVQQLYDGRTNSILCWKLDRLSRNPVDGGTVLWLVKKGVKIYTPGQIYSHEQESDLVMYVEFGMAQKFIDDLGKNVKRGLKAKAEMGWYPAHAPTGYINPDGRKGFRIVAKDPERFTLMRRAFDEILNGKQAMEVWQEARDVWHLTTPQGKPISNSAFYAILNNPFYYGEFEWPKRSGEWYIGKHEPMITREEFDLVQKMLGHAGKPVARSHEFDFTGLFTCRTCGCGVTGSKKVKHYKGTCRTATYTYYHHYGGKGRHTECCHGTSISEVEAKEQLTSLLLSIRPPKEFIDWAKRWVHVISDTEQNSQKVITETRQNALSNITRKIDRLLDMSLNGTITEDVYKEKSRELESEKRKLESNSHEENSPSSKVQQINDTLDFASVAANKFTNGLRSDKHFVLLKVSSNLWFDHKQILIDFKPEYKPLQSPEKWEELYVGKLEPQKYSDTLSKYPDLVPANPVWLEDRNFNITTQLSSIIQAFSDFRLVAQIREEIEKVKDINILPTITNVSLVQNQQS